MSTIPPLGPSDRVQPVSPAADVGDATRQPKPQPEQLTPKKQVVLRDDGQVEIHLEAGDPVVVALDEFVAKYREIFGQDPPSGLLVNEQA
ncbi:MAG: hypothetical protein KBC95_00105 [Candidatus Peribacteraceae bacterium]|nr:hypothetical protein [Candidatus Peribacteraceae bacterium]